MNVFLPSPAPSVDCGWGTNVSSAETVASSSPSTSSGMGSSVSGAVADVLGCVCVCGAGLVPSWPVEGPTDGLRQSAESTNERIQPGSSLNN